MESSGGLGARLAAWFPDREFFMRSQGQVRFVRVSSRMQKIAAGLVAAVLLLWVGSIGTMAISQFLSSNDRASLLEREAVVTKAESRVAAYRDDLDTVADDLKRRQTFIEEMVDSLPADAKAHETVSDSSGESAKAVAKISAVIPEAGALARIEARQLAFVEKLTRYADRRAARAAVAIRKLGLDPRAIMAASDEAGRGGPLELLTTERDGSLDPRFERLGLSLERLEALERGLAGIPQVLPASLSMISSGFGYRRDPFAGHAALHSGLDFRGPIGSPIYAAATGKVIFAGVKNGYGNVIEISHGNGLVTLYAHMSAFHARPGQDVQAGDIIGAIGNTGRSTGPHLHFEVRHNGRAVNPRPFLEAAPNVLKEVRAGSADRR
ncbi:peptidase M23 family protein [Caenibius tardaugens NBRC 16725]|uniref:Peptidase M23 family protein n=1 Tax=Caenibius tardaugens NBRC 16725 TaxID=1219035 RepID=U2YKW6_9SPHN|nr:M23 family metallopeptidase [Caenibius tardaugens]GAD48967.1 peptidase M23 family protein [Caenibius tardaugens NBRC 16725]